MVYQRGVLSYFKGGGVERGVTQYHTQGIYLTVISTSILCFTESEFFE